LTAGRLISGVIVGFAPVRRVLRFSILGILAGASLIWADLANPVSFAGLALIGLSCAPVFPSLIAATPARLGSEHAANAVGFQIAAAVLGQALLPALVGVFAGRFGLNVIGPALFTAAALLLALYEALTAASPKTAEGARAIA
jgi:fucose permease